MVHSTCNIFYMSGVQLSYARKQNFVCSAKTRPCITAKSGRGRRVIMLTSVIKLHHLLADVAFRFVVDTSFSRKFWVFRGSYIRSGYKSKMHGWSMGCSVLFCRFVCSDVKVRVECTRFVHTNKGNAERNKNNRRLENDNNKYDERMFAAVVIIRTDYGWRHRRKRR